MTTIYDEFTNYWAPANKAVADNDAVYASVQSAVDNASDTVLVGPGTFSEAVTITTANINVIGTGPGTVIDGGSSGVAVEIDASDVTIQTVKAQTNSGSGNNAINITSSGNNADLSRIRVGDAGDNGIRATNADDVTVSDSIIESASNGGVKTENGCPRAIIDNIRIRTNVSGDGISLSGDSSQVSTGTVVGVGSAGLDLSGNDQIVGDLLVDNPGGNGATLTGSDQLVHECSFTNIPNASKPVDSSSATRPILRGNTPDSINNGYTDADAQNAVGQNLSDGLSYDGAARTISLDVIDSGSKTLSSGSATVDTGIDKDATLTIFPAMGPDTDDADIEWDVRSDSGNGNYEVDIEEVDTSVGNPTVNYDIIQVRKSASSGNNSSTWIDTFDDTNLTEYNGDTGSFSFSSTSTQGSDSLTSSANSKHIRSTSGLDNYPSKGNRWEVFFRTDKVGSNSENWRQNFKFGLSDSDNYYAFRINWEQNDNIWLRKNDGGSDSTLHQVDTSEQFSANEWYRAEFTWDDGNLGGSDNDITVEFYNSSEDKIGTVMDNDSTHSGNSGIGMWANSTTSDNMYWDGADLL